MLDVTTGGVPGGFQHMPHAGGLGMLPRDVVLDCHIKELYYGSFKAVRDTAIPIRRIPSAKCFTPRRTRSTLGWPTLVQGELLGVSN